MIAYINKVFVSSKIKRSITLALLFFFSLTGCKVLSVNYRTLPAEIPLQDSIHTIVIVDAAEVTTPGIALTKKREEVVTQLKQDYITHLPDAMRIHLGNTSFVDTSLTDDEKILLLNDDAGIKQKIFSKYNAIMILVLKDCSGGFNQDEVVSEKQTDGSTSKKAYYSVFFQTHFHIIQPEQSWNKDIKASRRHSSRSVLSGLLARGPGYEANRKDIAEMANENAKKTSALFREQTVAVGGWMRQ